MKTPSLEEVISFVREFTCVGSEYIITENTRIEEDIGITGDDGIDLLYAAQKRFAVDLESPEKGIDQTFQLKPNEFFFRPEGFDPLGISALFRWLRHEPRAVYRDLTVGELYYAIQNAPPATSNSEV